MANLDKKIQQLEEALGKVTPVFNELAKGLKNSKGNGVRIDVSDDGMDNLYQKLDDYFGRFMGALEGRAESGAPTKGTAVGIGGNEEVVSTVAALTTSVGWLESATNENTRALRDVTSAIQEVYHQLSAVTGNASSMSASSEESESKTSVRPYDAKLNAILEEIINFHLDFHNDYKPQNMADGEAEKLTQLHSYRTLQELEERRYKEEIRKDANLRDDAWIKSYEHKLRNEQNYNKKKQDRLGVNWDLREFGKATVKGLWDTGKNFIGNESITASKTLDSAISMFSNMLPGMLGQVTGAILGAVKGLIEMGTKRDRAASEYARNIGGGAEGRKDFLHQVSEIYKQNEAHWGTMALKFDDIASAMTETAEAIGRVTDQMSPDEVTSLVYLKKFGIDANAFNQFDTLGMSAKSTAEYVSKMYSEAGARGLSFKNLSKAVVDNLKMAQKYSFADGLNGLTRMAEKSVQLKYNMQQVAQFADKVSTIEGAMKAAAGLSVLGGSYAVNADPLQLLYESLNDVEALNERMIDTFGEHAFFNQKTGQMDMAPIQRELMKAAAEATGASYDEMLNMTFRSAQGTIIENQLKGDKRKELEPVMDYIKNIAKLNKDGSATVMIDGIEKRVDQLEKADFESLRKESERRSNADNADLGSIYMETSNVAEKLDNILEWYQEKLGVWMMKIVAKITGDKSYNGELAIRAISDEREREMAMAYYQKNRGQGGFGSNERFANEIVHDMKYHNGRYRDIVDNYNSGPQYAKGREPSIDTEMPAYNQFSGRQFNQELFAGLREVMGPPDHEGGVPARLNGQQIVVGGGEIIMPEFASRTYRAELHEMMRNGYNPSRETHQTRMQNLALKNALGQSSGLLSTSRNMVNQVDGNLQNLSATVGNLVASTNLQKVHQPMQVAPTEIRLTGSAMSSKMDVAFSNNPVLTVRLEGQQPFSQVQMEKIALAAAKYYVDNNTPSISKNQQYYESRGGYDKENAKVQSGVIGLG